ncbi:MAG: futalosine hydrolase [Bacteroidia bacterium]|nr:MAG: futalosine hydrolase [Bacteroidia bacterium]
MRILFVSATELEISHLINDKPFLLNKNKKIYKYKNRFHDFEILITGIGSVFTTYKLTRLLQTSSFDLAINTGICGTFNPDLPIGSLVNITNDQFADLGIESENDFQSLFEKNFLDCNEFPFVQGALNPHARVPDFLEPVKKLYKAKGITVNTTHGNQIRIKEIKQKFGADTESMEGAAFFYVCMMEKLPCIQIRSLSNRVETRDASRWNIPLAIQNLNKFFLNLI